MSFGFGIADLALATELATKTIALLQADSEDVTNQDSIIILSFRSLQGQRIKELQQSLYRASLDRVGSLATPNFSAPLENDTEGRERDINVRIDTLLSDYAEAIRNYETLSQEALDLSSLKQESRLQSFLRHISGSPEPHLVSQVKEFQEILKDPNVALNFRELNKDIRVTKMQKRAFSERIWMGALGGVAVIGPMLLMSLHRTLTTSLVTTSVATVLFTLVLALGARNLRGQEILGAVAAYAAVLVVFIGTSIPPIT